MTINRIILDMPANEYHAHDAISKSGLDRFAISPAHYTFYREYSMPETAALNFGRAFHSMLLEPELNEVAVAPNVDKRTKAGKEAHLSFEADNAGKTIIGPAEYDTITGMSDAIQNSVAAKYMLEGKGRVEPSLFWQDQMTGVECRGRFDWLRDDGLIVDLKTTRSAKPEDFIKSVFNYRYHVQAAFYLDAYEQVTGKKPAGFVFIAVEKTPPYGVSVHMASAQCIHLGRMQYEYDMANYAECLKSNTWPSYPDEVLSLDFPEWIENKIKQGSETYV